VTPRAGDALRTQFTLAASGFSDGDAGVFDASGAPIDIGA
jgi:hypothetical protein